MSTFNEALTHYIEYAREGAVAARENVGWMKALGARIAPGTIPEVPGWTGALLQVPGMMVEVSKSFEGGHFSASKLGWAGYNIAVGMAEGPFAVVADPLNRAVRGDLAARGEMPKWMEPFAWSSWLGFEARDAYDRATSVVWRQQGMNELATSFAGAQRAFTPWVP
jgi:hypothetical protein